MTFAVLSRRGLIKASLLLAASTALSTTRLMAQEKTRLVVAADSEPKNLNPAVVASNGVFFLSSKVIEPLAEASFALQPGETTLPVEVDGTLVLAQVRERRPAQTRPFASTRP